MGHGRLVWGETLCDLCRCCLGGALLEGELLCVEGCGCADLVLERLVLVDEHPQAARHLLALADEARRAA